MHACSSSLIPHHCRVDNPALYQRYAPDAVFDDPAGIIRGRHGIRVTMEALVRGAV